MINYVYQLVSPKIISIKYQDLNVEGKVIIRPEYMALCHADQRYYQGSRSWKVLNRKLPMALVHECCGVVVEDNSGTFKVGEKVVVIPNSSPLNPNDEIYENYAKGSYFLSSGHDGFMREFISLPPDRVVSYDAIDPTIAAITEFASVAVHGISRFEKISHNKKKVLAIWGDGSLAYMMSAILKELYPKSKIVVLGKNESKLSYFSFVDETYLIDSIPSDFECDHAFECVGGEGSYYAIDDVIKRINPQGTVILMGVSENKVPIYTRDILEKGLTFIGSSRSGRKDFEKALELMNSKRLQNRLSVIVTVESSVNKIEDIDRIFKTDLGTPFKTVFRWNI